MSWAEFPIFGSKITRRRPDADRRSSAAGLAALVGLRASSGRTRAASLRLVGVGGTLPSFDPLLIWRRWTDDVEGYGLDYGNFLPEEPPR